ncbi:peroxisomal oxidase [Mycena floridula]|nr:peroxisomal oxidase [Mycena floridula]
MSSQNAVDMQKARSLTNFNVSRLRQILHPDWESRQRLVSLLSSDPVFDKKQRPFMTRTELFNRGLRMTNRILELQALHGWSNNETNFAFHLAGEPIPIYLHNTAFAPVLALQGGEYLTKKYGALISSHGILGCYLQTELGHGTNVGALETTATYLPKTREFEIHSPTVTSSKWWIGALGKTATHGVVQAKLILPDGKDMGPHLFFVQLRSMDDHKLLPGITAGDIGPKALGGYAAVDNGFAIFDHVHIPKEHMLSQFASVTDEGKYMTPPHPKLSYGGMLYIRTTMISVAGWATAKAATISIRYCTVRRQGGGTPERPVISYPSTSERLIPILARAYMFIELGKALTKSFELLQTRLTAGDTSLLADQHIILSGLKVFCSASSIADIETARRSMGGHGYSAFSGLGNSYADLVPSATYEGDNFVLDNQVLRGAVKAFRLAEAEQRSTLSESSRYLRLLQQVPPLLDQPKCWSNPETSILLLEWRAALLVAQAAKDPDTCTAQRVSKAVTEAYVAARVGEMIQGSGGLPTKEIPVLAALLNLYLLTTVESALVDLLSYGLFRVETSSKEDPTRFLRLAIKNLCAELVPQAIGLTDAFGFSDWELDSALGRYDGEVYKALLARTNDEPLNADEVTPAYKESIKPVLQRGARRATEAKL